MISSLQWAYHPTSRVVCSIYRYSGPKNNTYSDREYNLQGFPLVIHCFKRTPSWDVHKYYCAYASQFNKRKLHEILVQILPLITAVRSVRCKLQQIILTQPWRCSSIAYVENHTNMINFVKNERAFCWIRCTEYRHSHCHFPEIIEIILMVHENDQIPLQTLILSFITCWLLSPKKSVEWQQKKTSKKNIENRQVKTDLTLLIVFNC